jgi:hypothetical protein
MSKQLVVFTFLFLMVCSYKLKAQGGEFVFNGKGQPFTKTTPVDIEGDPYLFDKWMPGKVLTVNGKVYDNLKLKYDVYEDYLLFAYDSADEPLKFSDDVKSFTIILPQPLTFAKGFPPIGKQTGESYYQVLSYGKTMFLKRISKIVNESKNYNSSVSVKNFQDYNTYYTYSSGKIKKVENPKKTLYALASTKKADLDNYLKINPVNFKKDEDLARVFDYYNTLTL